VLDDYDEEEKKESPDRGSEVDAVYIDNSRLNTDGCGETSMAEEDLGISYASGRTSEASLHGQKFSNLSIKTTLPALKINVPLSITHHDIFDIFSAVSGKEKF